MNSIEKEIAGYLFNLRIKNKLTQKDMSELMNISIPQYSAIEKKRVRPMTIQEDRLMLKALINSSEIINTGKLV